VPTVGVPNYKGHTHYRSRKVQQMERGAREILKRIDLRLLEDGAHNLLEQASTVKSEVQSE